MKQHDEILQRAIGKWGDESQLAMVTEECAELILALAKMNRVGGRSFNLETATANAIDEIADVTIMVRQAALIFGEAAVNERISYKLERLKFRLDSAKQNEGTKP